MVSEIEYKTILDRDCGDPVFAEYAELLISEARLEDAIKTCLAGLTKNPECHKGRLALAYGFFKSGYLPFALREIEYLSYYLPDNEALRKLLNKLDPLTESVATEGSNSSQEVADIEFDLDALQGLGSSKK